ncbi:MAG: hypothetical protein WBG54_21575 [Acidobacteriaceae bacterium]
MSAAAEPVAPDAPRKTLSAHLFSLPVVMGLALVCLLVFFSNPVGGRAVSAVADPDIGWHLRDAAQLLHTRHFIRTETWTFTVAGQPWINFEWMAELPYYFVYQQMGDAGLYLLMMLLMTAIVVGVYLLCRLRSGSWNAAFLASVAAVLFATVSFAPRTLLFGWLFLVIELGILWSLEKGRDYTAFLPLLFLLWINTHGSWFIGFVLMLLFFSAGWIEGQWGNLFAVPWTPAQKKKFLLVMAASLALLFVNPYGWRLVAYPLDVAFRQKATLQYIAEWGSLDFHTVRAKVVLGVYGLLVLLQLIRRIRWKLQDLIFLAVAVYGGFTYVRFLFMAGILVAPLLAIHISRRHKSSALVAKGERWVNGFAIAVLLAFIVLRIPTGRQLRAGVAANYPEKALPYVRALAGQGNLFNDFKWGTWLEWNAPQVKEFADTRVDIFVHEGILRDYLRATRGEDTDAILDKYRIRYVLMSRDTPMVYLLEHEPDWKITYQDDQAVVLERIH